MIPLLALTGFQRETGYFRLDFGYLHRALFGRHFRVSLELSLSQVCHPARHLSQRHQRNQRQSQFSPPQWTREEDVALGFVLGE